MKLDLSVIPPRSEWADEGNVENFSQIVSRAQELRGEVYLKEGAIREEELDCFGRYILPIDSENFHIVFWGAGGELAGAWRARVHPHPTGPEHLQFSSFLDRALPESAPHRRALAHAISDARDQKVFVGELSGWVINPAYRHRRSLLELHLAAYPFFEGFGGARVFAYATHRHSSADILLKFGGVALELDGEPLAAHFDPCYGCLMQIIHFDSGKPPACYADKLRSLSVFLGQRMAETRYRSFTPMSSDRILTV